MAVTRLRQSSECLLLEPSVGDNLTLGRSSSRHSTLEADQINHQFLGVDNVRSSPGWGKLGLRKRLLDRLFQLPPINSFISESAIDKVPVLLVLHSRAPTIPWPDGQPLAIIAPSVGMAVFCFVLQWVFLTSYSVVNCDSLLLGSSAMMSYTAIVSNIGQATDILFNLVVFLGTSEHIKVFLSVIISSVLPMGMAMSYCRESGLNMGIPPVVSRVSSSLFQGGVSALGISAMRVVDGVGSGIVRGGRIRGDKKNGGSGGAGASSSAGTKYQMPGSECTLVNDLQPQWDQDTYSGERGACSNNCRAASS
ncbi:hypothetical protein Tco_1539574 [Tanacetum coccineum]